MRHRVTQATPVHPHHPICDLYFISPSPHLLEGSDDPGNSYIHHHTRLRIHRGINQAWKTRSRIKVMAEHEPDNGRSEANHPTVK